MCCQCLQFSGHKDSVSTVGFSYDGVYIATADLGGSLKVWKVSSLEEVWAFECDDIEVGKNKNKNQRQFL